MAGRDAPNATMAKFGAPATCVREYTYWTVLLRPKQATLGALILAAREPAAAFGELSKPACEELAVVSAAIEAALEAAVSYDKINYLMLMMNDPDVHFHVLPRYASERYFEGVSYTDPGWPGPPDLSHVNPTDDATNQRLVAYLAGQWPPH
jgi:diadenosine tetraphosphate (Ap4A) HIT family hydrolase